MSFGASRQAVSGIGIGHLSDVKGKWQAAAVMGGKIYAIPYNAHRGNGTEVPEVPEAAVATVALRARWGSECSEFRLRQGILVIDPVTSAATTIDVTSLDSGTGKWGFAAAIGAC